MPGKPSLARGGITRHSAATMIVYLLRHAEAEDTYPDPARRLTGKGRRSVEQLCDFLKKKEFADVSAVWHSPLVRAYETATVFREALKIGARLVETSGLRPEDEPALMARRLAEHEKGDLVLVGHNPNMEGLASHLFSGEELRPFVEFKKTGLLCAERLFGRDARNPCGIWQLKYLLTPKLF